MVGLLGVIDRHEAQLVHELGTSDARDLDEEGHFAVGGLTVANRDDLLDGFGGDVENGFVGHRGRWYRDSSFPWQPDDHGVMPRVAVVLPTATYRTRDFVEAAVGLGVDLTVVSERRQLLSDEPDFLLADLDHPAEAARQIIERSARTPFDAIIAVDDAGVLSAAYAAEALGLAHNPPHAVAATRNKATMRRALRGAVRQPPFQVAEPGIDVAALASELGFPVVLKPLSLSASRGVIRADTPADVRQAVERIRLILARAGRSPSEPLLVERFVPGAEVVVEGVLRKGELDVLAILDKPDPLDGPFFEETFYVTPSRHHIEVLDEVVAVVRSAVAALGLVEGAVHAELRIDGPFVRLIEIAARSIGGLCGRALRFGLLGTSLETILLRAALGRPLPPHHMTDAASGVLMLPIARSGRLEGIDGVDRALSIDGVTDVEVSVPVGERIEALPEGNRYLGFVFARGTSPSAVETALRRALDTITIRIGDDPIS